MTATTAEPAMTDPATLPQFEGRPVPWVTRWSGEVTSERVAVEIDREHVFLTYQHPQETRDEHGVLWRQEGILRRGNPLWAEINAHRQRLAMRKRLCQVCGTKIDGRPIRWLVPHDQLWSGDPNRPQDAGTKLTISAPTCDACIPLAQKLCPFLKSKDTAILRVLDYEMWGVYGEAVSVDRETGRGKDLRGIYVPYEDSPVELSAVLAFQQVVRLTKFVIEE